MDLFESQNPARYPGIRLHRLEIQNWGTFDREIFVLPFEGRTSLLIGNNGTGKTTLSDALLTLLVDNAKRNYNVSASAYGRKRGRNEASYIRGAFKETSHAGEIQAKSENLRAAEGTLSILLAVFHNESTGKSLTIAQILYIASGKASKIYCHCEDDRGIKNDLSGFRELRAIKPELKRRGFTVCESASAYFENIRTWTGMRRQALDVFNQTVAVKEIENLNEFIRRYMLDPPEYEARIRAIITHYQDLETAYRRIEHAADQLQRLEPIVKQGEKLEKLQQQQRDLERNSEVAEFFFSKRKEALYENAIQEAQTEISTLTKQQASVREKREDAQNQLVSLESEKKLKGGHLNTLEGQLEKLKLERQKRHDQRSDFYRALKALNIEERPGNDNELNALLNKIRHEVEVADDKWNQARNDYIQCRHDRDECEALIKSEEAELKHLQGRSSNIPTRLGELRTSICDKLNIKEQRLPFAGELIQVKESESIWQQAAELVLRNFGLTLLVPPDLYPQIVTYAEEHKLADASGRGLLLEYEQVDPEDSLHTMRSYSDDPHLLANKLEFKPGHAFSQWVQRELRERFSYRCVESLEEFRNHRGGAITRHAQIRSDRGRTRKDDRDRSRDPRNFILGWDNAAKRDALQASITKSKKQFEQLTQRLDSIRQTENYWNTVKNQGPIVLNVSHWEMIDVAAKDAEIEAKTKEIEQYKSQSSDLQNIESQIQEAKENRDRLDHEYTEIDRKIQKRKSQCETWENSRLAAFNARQLKSTPKPDELELLENELKQHYLLNLDSIEEDARKCRERMSGEINTLQHKTLKLEGELEKGMTGFLEHFRGDGFEEFLKAEAGYWKEFRDLYRKINGDRLPQYKERFRKMARDRVQQELAQFNQSLRMNANDIKERIGEINQALRDIEYESGTYMHLLCQKARHHERDELQRHLHEALDDRLGGQRTFEEAEAFFKSIEPLLHKLKDDGSWAGRASDVRYWFEFAASERRDSDDTEVRYLRSTETASGGEKAKLAFTILVAALVYQYNIDPRSNHSNRFRLAVVDEAFAKVDDRYATYALNLFQKFGLQLIVIAPFDPKARVVEPFADYYVMTAKRTEEDGKDRSQIFSLTKEEFRERMRQSSASQDVATTS